MNTKFGIKINDFLRYLELFFRQMLFELFFLLKISLPDFSIATFLHFCDGYRMHIFIALEM